MKKTTQGKKGKKEKRITSKDVPALVNLLGKDIVDSVLKRKYK